MVRATVTPIDVARTRRAVRPEPLLRNLIGGVLRARRTDLGRTLDDVAARSGISAQYISEVERGRKEASSEVLAALCVTLDLTLPDLLGEARRVAGAADGAGVQLRAA
jgi:transcriptional regulator with XRE-family HTH domain